MKWSNLKQNKCPNCNKSWSTTWGIKFENGVIICKCGFKISEKKMSEIVSDKVDREILENLEQEVLDETSN